MEFASATMWGLFREVTTNNCVERIRIIGLLLSMVYECSLWCMYEWGCKGLNAKCVPWHPGGLVSVPLYDDLWVIVNRKIQWQCSPGIYDREVQGPEDTTGWLEGNSIGQRHVAEIYQLRSPVFVSASREAANYALAWATGQTCQLVIRSGR